MKERIPLPKSALMKRPSAPNCEFRTASLDQSGKQLSDASPPSKEGKLDADLRMKLDYERECYRLAELIVRTQLAELQDAVRDTAKAVRRRDRNRDTP